jgi:hypothetical protein
MGTGSRSELNDRHLALIVEGRIAFRETRHTGLHRGPAGVRPRPLFTSVLHPQRRFFLPRNLRGNAGKLTPTAQVAHPASRQLIASAGALRLFGRNESPF